MKYNGEIHISWQAGSGEITTAAKGCDADIVDVLAKSTASVLKNVSLFGLRGKDLLDVYIAFLIDLYGKDHPVEMTSIKIPLSDIPGGAQ